MELFFELDKQILDEHKLVTTYSNGIQMYILHLSKVSKSVSFGITTNVFILYWDNENLITKINNFFEIKFMEQLLEALDDASNVKRLVIDKKTKQTTIHFYKGKSVSMDHELVLEFLKNG